MKVTTVHRINVTHSYLQYFLAHLKREFQFFCFGSIAFFCFHFFVCRDMLCMCVCVYVYIHPSGIQFQGCDCFPHKGVWLAWIAGTIYVLSLKTDSKVTTFLWGDSLDVYIFLCGRLSSLGFPFPKKSTGNCFAHVYSQVIAHEYMYILLSVVWFHPLESLEEKSTPCCPFHRILFSCCSSDAFNAFVQH